MIVEQVLVQDTCPALQSHGGRLTVAPALPPDLRCGTNGLRIHYPEYGAGLT